MAESAQNQLIFLLSVGTIGVLLLTVFIVFFFFTYQKRIFSMQDQKQRREIEFQQEMVRSQLDSQEKERVRIASDLHDSLGSLLWGAKVNASFIERTVVLEGETKVSYKELMTTLDHSIDMVRRIAWELTPEAFQHTGLSASLTTLCDRVNGKGMRVTFEEHGSRIWQDERALQVFRIVQELVSNCIKHACATELKVCLTWEEHTVVLEVSDDGIGFNLTEIRTGVGWWSIKQRGRQLRAEIDIGKTPVSGGSVISLKVPLLE